MPERVIRLTKKFPNVTIDAQYHPVGGYQTRLVEVWRYPDRTETFYEDELFDGLPEHVSKYHRWEHYIEASH